ncbi:MAG TPA: trimethylamine methyltransferase family protein [Steroidobacteraceae bacterium]
MNRPPPRGRRSRTAPVAGPAYVTRALPYYAMLDEEALVRIETQALRLLERIGIEFRDDPNALQRWRQAGAEVSGTRVRTAPELVKSLLASAPAEFTQVARNPARSVQIGGKHQVFAPVYGSPFVRDLEGGRRYGTLEDFRRLVKLTHQLAPLHHSGFVTCEPCDIPVSKRHLDMLLAHMTLTDKPHLGAITEKSRAEDSIAMARLLHGPEVFDHHCVILGNVNTNSPLLVDKVVTQAAEVYCGAGQGIIAVPFILSGAMGPVTTAAAIAQALAEAMIVGAYTQLVRPGAPFILGNFLSSMNLRSGAPTFGMPEPLMSNLVIGQLARRLELPLRCGGALTASKLPDYQAAAESADSMLSTVLGGAHYVLHAAGWLEGGLTTGYEKLVLDADRLGAYEVVLRGFATDDDSLGVDAYGDVEPGGHFLGSAHTLSHYTSAFYEAALSDSNSVEQWEEQGGKDAARRALDRWKQLLATYVEPPIDPAVREALDDYVARRKAALPDAWY